MPQQMHPDAQAISHDLLERTGIALKTRDFELFEDCFLLPHTITTFDTTYTLQTQDELRRAFFGNCDFFQKLHVTNIVRHCEMAQFEDENTVKAMHVTHLMSGQIRVKDPYPSFSVIVRMPDGWRVASSDYAVDATNGLTQVLQKIAAESGPTSSAH